MGTAPLLALTAAAGSADRVPRRRAVRRRHPRHPSPVVVLVLPFLGAPRWFLQVLGLSTGFLIVILNLEHVALESSQESVRQLRGYSPYALVQEDPRRPRLLEGDRGLRARPLEAEFTHASARVRRAPRERPDSRSRRRKLTGSYSLAGSRDCRSAVA